MGVLSCITRRPPHFHSRPILTHHTGAMEAGPSTPRSRPPSPGKAANRRRKPGNTAVDASRTSAAAESTPQQKKRNRHKKAKATSANGKSTPTSRRTSADGLSGDEDALELDKAVDLQSEQEEAGEARASVANRHALQVVADSPLSPSYSQPPHQHPPTISHRLQACPSHPRSHRSSPPSSPRCLIRRSMRSTRTHFTPRLDRPPCQAILHRALRR